MKNKNLKVEYININELKPWENNAKQHPREQVEQIKKSIEMYGMADPLGIWKDNTVIEGHGRLMACKELGIEEVPVIRLDDLTDKERREYMLAHNQTTMNSGWDFEKLEEELKDLDFGDFDFGFDLDFDFQNNNKSGSAEFFDRENRNDASKQEGNEEYKEFLDKFEPKKTTDDCYTPDIIYNAVADWVSDEYGIEKKKFVRPFYPNGDYQKEKYEKDCVVVDNPPFSILAEILNFYDEKKIKFFLFAPTLTLFSPLSSANACSIPLGVTVTYENGANVDTSFITNIETENRIRSAPTLYKAVNEANKENLRELKRELPKYEYNDYIITSTRVGQFSKHGIDFQVPKDESKHIRQLDQQKESGKEIFGRGYIVSERVKKEKEKAERVKKEKEKAEREKAELWELSEREMEIVKSLGK